MSETNKQRLEIIANNINVCTKCELCNTPGKHVPGTGLETAKIVALGEAPGATEAECGLPFVGRAGKLLDGLLEMVGLSRDKIYILNTVCCRPPENRKPLPKESQECRHFLVEQLEILNPDIIIALGNSALGAITGIDGGIVKRCGKWETTNIIGKNTLVMPCFHPSGILRNPNWKEPTLLALKEAFVKASVA
jgi:DNA polymerase